MKTYGDTWTLPIATSNVGTVVCDKTLGDLANVNTYTVTYSIAETDNYSGDSKQLSVTINRATAVITVDQTAIVKTYGDTWTLPVATSNVGTVVCNKSLADLANVNTYTVTFSIAETDNYSGDSKQVSVTIHKATYDMSGITFADKTVKANKTAQSITIGGTLPSGVTVAYTGNGQTTYGVYTVTAVFTGDANNYNSIANKTATLKILIDEFSKNVDDNTSEVSEVVVSSESGFEPDLKLIIKSASKDDSTIALSKSESVEKVYNISLVRGEEAVALSNTVTVKLLVPAKLEGSNFAIYSGNESVAYTLENGYAVFTIDTLDDLVIVKTSNSGSLAWLIILCCAVIPTAILLGTYKIYQTRTAKKNKQA